MPLMTKGGSLWTVDGALAVSDLCCPCDVIAGCCPTTLTDGAVLDVEVIAVTGGVGAYFTVGEHFTLTGGPIWTGPTKGVFCDLNLNCIDDDRLSLQWNQTACCPGTDTSGTGTPWDWTLDSGECDPFEFVFTWTFNEPDITGCPSGLTGTLTVRVTIV